MNRNRQDSRYEADLLPEGFAGQPEASPVLPEKFAG